MRCKGPALAILFWALFGGSAARPDPLLSAYDPDVSARKAIQLNLIWTGYYPGPVDGALGATTIQAIRRFQTENGEPPTGTMSLRVRDALARRAEQEQKKIDFRFVNDPGTGARIGIPFAYVPQQHSTLRGWGYYSSDDSIEIQTVAVFTALRDLQSLYVQLKDKIPNRTVWYSPFRDTWFVLAGRDLSASNEEKDFYVRFHTNGIQARGFSISYKPDRYPNIAPIIGAMSFTYDPFATPTIIASAREEGAGGPLIPVQPTPPQRTAVPMDVQGGVYVVPIKINDTITLKFVVDSGAADVAIPADVFFTLLRAGTISESDILGERKYSLADGSELQGINFRIRSLTVGDKTIENIRGSIAPLKGELLLGQSFLSRFKSWSIDNYRHALVLE